MADDANGFLTDNVGKHGQIEDELRHGVDSAGRPGTIAMAAKIDRVDVIIGAEGARNPVPAARVIEAAVDEQNLGVAILAVIPKLQLETIRVEEVRNRFPEVQCLSMLAVNAAAFYPHT